MYLLADIGGTKTRIARTSDLEVFEDPVIVGTPQNYEEGIRLIAETGKRLAGNESIERLITGCPAPLSPDRRSLFYQEHIPDWAKRPFADDLERALQTSVHLENDNVLVGLGEAHKGAGVGARIVVYYTVSTGVNGVCIAGGRSEPGVFGFEAGHQYLFLNGEARFLSDFVSGIAIEKKYGKHPREIGKDSPVWEELAEMFAYGLHNSIVHWSPERVVLGGSMFNEIGISVERVEFHLRRIMTIFPDIPELVHAKLGDLGGLWGGMVRLKQLG